MGENKRAGNVQAGILVLLFVVFVLIGIKVSSGRENSNINTTSEVCEKLEEYTVKVYAPKSMDEFNTAKAEAVELGIMTEAVANQYFKAYSQELTEADLKRTCFARATHGGSEYSSTGTEQYMVSATLYNTPTSSPMKITVLFRVGDSGVIDNYDIIVGV